MALATLALTIRHDGKQYASFEARSMVMGAAAFFIYAVAVSWLLRRYRPSALRAALGAMPIWFVISLGLWNWLGHSR
jgi:hypothetical protein